MTKRQLIDNIRQFNPSAQDSFLDQFDETDLKEYLGRLQDARDQRPRIQGWVRGQAKAVA